MPFKRRIPEDNVRRTISTGQNQPGIYTNHIGDQLQYKSQSAEIVCVILDRDRTVKKCISQPETFLYADDEGKIHKYTPDFKVFREDGSIEIHDVICDERRFSENIQLREQAVKRICKERGWIYVVHTNETLPKATERTNLRAFRRYRATCNARPAVEDAARAKLLGASVLC